MKKLGIAIGLLIALFFVVALVVPMVVDVDKYRPEIVHAANQQINGKLELGKLRLSLWGQVRIEIGGLKLLDSAGQEVVGVKDAYFHVPLMPLLSGSPILDFKMSQPVVNIVKERNGKLNVLSLAKPSVNKGEAPSASAKAPSTAAPAPSENKVVLPGFVAHARLGVELKNALITYLDRTTGLTAQVKDLNFIIKDISLTHPTELEMWADLDTRLGKTFQLRGPARLTAKAQPKLKGAQFDSLSLTANLNLDALEMAAPPAFYKKKDVPAHVDLALTASESEAKIEKFVATFFNAEINAQGTATHLSGGSGASGAPSPSGGPGNGLAPVVHMTVSSNSIELSKWVELIPMLREFELGGSAQFSAEASGPSDRLGYRGKFSIVGLTAKAPQLKAQPKFDAAVQFSTDQIDKFLLTMRAPSNDLQIEGKLVSFAQPRLDMAVGSTGMDLDQLIVMPASPPAAQGGGKEKGVSQAPSGATQGTAPRPGGASPQPTADYDELLAPLRENKMLAAFVANIGINMKHIIAKGVKVSDIGCKLSWKDLAAGVDVCSFKLFSGGIRSDFHMQMKPKMSPKTPTYQFGAQVNGLDLAQAMESQMALFKNTLTGKANFSMKGQGASLNPDPAISNLKAQGNFKVDQASFATIDVMKMVGESLGKALAQIGEKIPAARGKTIPPLGSGASRYEFISSDFSIAGGKFSAPNFYAKALPNQGIDIKGATTVGIKDKSLDTSWDVIDTYNMTRLRDISVSESGVQVDHIFAEGNSPVHFPIHAGCTITAPCYSSTEIPAALSKVALANVSHAVEGRARQELQRQAESVIKKVVPPSIQNQVQDKLKKFF